MSSEGKGHNALGENVLT